MPELAETEVPMDHQPDPATGYQNDLVPALMEEWAPRVVATATKALSAA
jgi:hypothetical protein